MASKGLRSAFVSTVTKVEAGDKVSHTTETLICYTVCYAALLLSILVKINSLNKITGNNPRKIVEIVQSIFPLI